MLGVWPWFVPIFEWSNTTTDTLRRNRFAHSICRYDDGAGLTFWSLGKRIRIYAMVFHTVLYIIANAKLIIVAHWRTRRCGGKSTLSCDEHQTGPREKNEWICVWVISQGSTQTCLCVIPQTYRQMVWTTSASYVFEGRIRRWAWIYDKLPSYEHIDKCPNAIVFW